MKRHVSVRGVRVSAAAATVMTLGLGACMQAPDMSAIEAERSKQVQRYDIFQALAANGRAIVAGTQSGALLVSTDGGKQWKRNVVGPVSIVGLATCPDGSFVGIDFYHTVWHAAADAAKWESVKLDKPRTALAVSCDLANRWWVAGTNSTIAGSADKGKSWQVSDLGEDAQLTSVQFVDAQNGIATGEFGLVVKSSDGGKTWAKNGKIPDEFYPYAALFLNRDEGWVSGLAGQVLHTRDGGNTWEKQTNATGAPLYRLLMHDKTPFGVGAGGVVARYDGNGWQPLPYPDAVPSFLGSGASLSPQPALIVGGPGGLVRAIATAAN